MTSNYERAVLAAEIAYDVESARPEYMVAMGYRAGIQDATDAVTSLSNDETNNWLKEKSMRGAAARGRNTTIRVFHEKLSAMARRFEKHASKLGV